MSVLTTNFLFDLESNMRTIASNEYERLNSNLWWSKVAKYLPSSSKSERINWLLETATIRRPNAKHGGGQMIFEDLVFQSTEFKSENAVSGLKIKKEQLEDLDGNGIDLATSWSRGVGSFAAYWPQQELAKAILNNPITYDGLPFFHNAHKTNPYDLSAGTFANVFTGAASAGYPGAVPIDSSVSADVALLNLQKAIAYVNGSIKMPNGTSPRMLRVAGILHPASLTGRVAQLTDSKFIAQSAVSGGGAADIEGVINRLGLGQSIEAPELGAAYENGSDTDYYLVVENITSSELGAFVYVDREPFSIVYHGEMTDAQLARTRELQWTTEGRNVVGAGHPFLLFKCRAS